jgi:hypothetical protein
MYLEARRILGWPAPTQPMLWQQHSAQNECRRRSLEHREGVEHKAPECVEGKENARPQRLLRVRIRRVDVGALGAKGS